MKHLVLGGVKSGKSKFAEECAESSYAQGSYSNITLVATAQALDDEMAKRIERHQEDRLPHWKVIEEPLALARVLQGCDSHDNVLVIDCLTLWLTNLLMLEDERELESAIIRFERAVQEYRGDLILVSNETNMGIMPLGELSRRYCDIVGTLHKKLADLCDRVDLLVAGLPLALKPSRNCSCSSNN